MECRGFAVMGERAANVAGEDFLGDPAETVGQLVALRLAVARVAAPALSSDANLIFIFILWYIMIFFFNILFYLMNFF